METVILTFVLCLMAPTASAESQPIELSIMSQTIDDMFAGCNEKMATKVQEVYFPREIQNSPFQNAWNLAEPCAETNLDKLPAEHKELTKENLQAICAYTDASTKLYSQLNRELRNGATMYDTPAFQYHTLYFWLTSALQILQRACETTYRRTRSVYDGKIGTTIRFGYFASTSRNPNVVEYGEESCFHIKTCYGAYIGDYSVVPSEEEVLVPTYEKFRIVDIVSDSYGELKCKKIFVLESEGYSTNLNCNQGRTGSLCQWPF
ncbi:hypothetical protein NL108_009963 [Boleophthalmus pectinirostris]|uniref:NAD(P)(+)--arginine ADP-ribosyltransferase 1-like n=1 Tax=Boleophthalmus pectinirostris TaxID=150288 RepID=UPI00243282E7|nr:NAD(P)(+)--arginine ADP-ribosyltransferase 1-like [Boleophthalmus pectinirostris]KAJ0055710.1 hypothetical protein NL108_009963 [Boleophthalmus pectinirostris]